MRETVVVYADELEKLRHRLVGIQTYVKAKKIESISSAIDTAVDICTDKMVVLDEPKGAYL